MTWGRKKNQRVLQTLGLMKQLPFQHLHSEDIRKLSVFKPVAIQYIFSTLSNLKKILNNVEISNATNYNSKLMNCSQKKTKLQTSVSVSVVIDRANLAMLFGIFETRTSHFPKS